MKKEQSQALISISKVEASVMLKLIETAQVEYTLDEKVAVDRLRKEFGDVLRYWTKIESLVIKKSKTKLETIIEEAGKINPEAKLSETLELLNEQKLNKHRKTVTGDAGKRILNRKGIK